MSTLPWERSTSVLASLTPCHSMLGRRKENCFLSALPVLSILPTTDVGYFFSPNSKQFSSSLQTSMPCPAIQFWHYLSGVSADPTGWRLSPIRLCPLQMPVAQVMSLQVTLNFCPTWLQIRGSQGPLLRFYNLVEELIKLKRTADLLDD